MPTDTPTTHSTHYVKKIARILLKIILFLLLFIVVVFLLILTPPVQRFATHKVADYLENKLKTRVDIGGISFGLTGNIHLHDIYIEDQTKDTLLSGGTIKANVNLLKLLSNEVKVKDVTIEDITAKIKRVLPDTVFNFQFIADAFMSENTKQPDTAQTAPLKLDVNSLTLDNINVVFKDAITGNDMYLHLGNLFAKFDTINPYTSHYAVPTVKVSNVVARLSQTKPLIEPEPMAQNVAEASQPITMNLNFGTIDLNKINVQYDNDVSALYAKLNVDELVVDGKKIDLPNRLIHLDEIRMNNTATAVRLGKTPQAKEQAKAVSQQAEAQAQIPWVVRVDKVNLNNDQIKFDDDSKPRAAYGMDYSHLNIDSLTLHVNDMVFSSDTMAAVIAKASMREQSGFQLDQLEGNLFYGPHQAYVKNLLFKTPGSELKRDIVLDYPSLKALTDSLNKVQMDINIPDSYIQVKDILVFAPQLRTQPAFANRNAVWHINLQANGNMDRLHIANLQFSGLRNTHINASGTLANATNPNAAGGFFTIKDFHTTKSDIALLSGGALPAQINLPQNIDIKGTVNGTVANLRTNLRVYTSSGNMALNGHFTNLTNPARATYNAALSTNGLQLGRILSNPQLGNLSANIQASGTGFTPDAINTSFKGNIYSVGYNNYVYRNIRLNGSLHKTVFDIHTDINDPNIDLNLTASGDYAGNPSFNVSGMIDSVKTMPLHFTTQPLIFRGKIDADVPTVNADYLEANVLITQALFVSGENRLPVDTLQLVANHSDTGEYIQLHSDIVNATLQGQYRLSELGAIMQNNIQPYFTVGSYKAAEVHPYNISFSMDVMNSPLLSAFVPGLDITDPIHASGRLATGQGLQATIASPHIVFSGNEISGLDMQVHTDATGMHVAANVDRLSSGSSMSIYHTSLNATALNNNVNFSLNIDDKSGKDKYYLSGLVTQPDTSTYTLHLNPDSLLLNYARWSIAPNNSIAYNGKSILANNFTLQQAAQQLAIQSQNGAGNPLNVTFDNFKLATITGFVQSDSLFINGLLNGSVTLKNLMQQPVFTTDLTVNDLSMYQDTIGNVNIQVNNNTANRYQTLATITGRGNDVTLSGYFEPQGKDMALNLDLAIRQIQLSTIEGATQGAISNASGNLTGNVAVRGTTIAPKVNGSINFDRVAFDSKFIGRGFKIDGQQLVVREDGFHFNDFTVNDSANNTLVLDGTALTPNFTNYNFDLTLKADNFEMINTTKKQGDVYYGQLFLNTDLRIMGTEQNPVVDGAITINDNTNLSIVIPQQEPGVVSREGIVAFVDMDAPQNDTLFRGPDTLTQSSRLEGYNVSLNITINKNAIFNIIVDEANGDFLNVQGDAQLSAGIDPSGKITLAGSYVINSGAYQLSYNFLQRRFEIQPGSKIVWLGDPMQATLDLTAIYIANTAPLDLVQDQLSGSQTAIRNTYLQKLPFQVLLKLGGELMKPDISFNITLPGDKNYNVSKDVIQTVDTRLTQLRQEPSEMNKQVFALLLLGRFVGENPFQSSGEGFNAGSFARQSVSKLLTEQLNRLAGDLIQGVDLNFDVTSASDYTTGTRRDRTDLNVGLSKRLLSNRLTVSVGSNFELEGPQNANQRSTNLAGNVALNYQLSKDGRYMLRVYRKNEYEAELEGYVIETGLSFIITLDYNHLRDIFIRQKIQKGIDDSKSKNSNGD